MKILTIETSCDETALALVEAGGGLKNPRFKVLENLVSSQVKIHRPFGGVVPNLAKREHLKNLPILLKRIEKKIDLSKIDLLAVTVGPGLEPALWVGINFSRVLAEKLKKPLIGANHLEGHLYSFLLTPENKIPKIFPATALLVSGGHTILLKMTSLTQWKKIGETRDDAAGEAYDKVARLLDFPYPGGPEIEKAARKIKSGFIDFPRPMMNQKNYDFSFSGLKTAVLYAVRDWPGKLGEGDRALVAASFQRAAVEVLVKKTIRAAKETKAKSIILSGGVAANKFLRSELKEGAEGEGLNFLVPEFEFNTDNAAMIAPAAYFSFLRKKKRRLIAQANLSV
ncbi:MAG TPA: tRNA (adenosine(37)-N6)-threonylcarbamoyltransferase complex transferase subunit TsaD [Candidatus Tyrphobacter sp.]|nr:tRNA (adenosine(37)-N6)-threonylcarbamoyltransferase complex transferase subunit TsaD [Candidatus Tyrphobacter sp.]